jgi:hypothetical protein
MQVLQNIKSHNETQLLQILTLFKYCNKKNLIKGANIIKLEKLVQFFYLHLI